MLLRARKTQEKYVPPPRGDRAGMRPLFKRDPELHREKTLPFRTWSGLAQKSEVEAGKQALA